MFEECIDALSYQSTPPYESLLAMQFDHLDGGHLFSIDTKNIISFDLGEKLSIVLRTQEGIQDIYEKFNHTKNDKDAYDKSTPLYNEEILICNIHLGNYHGSVMTLTAKVYTFASISTSHISGVLTTTLSLPVQGYTSISTKGALSKVEYLI
jgi:hypothetical protein